MSAFAPKPRILVAYSGGRTSGLMANRIKALYGATHEIVNAMDNTGLEDPRTLVFADKCDRHFGLNLVWLEAVVNPEHGEGTTHKVVSFETAARNGEPFEAVIQKYGIPNSAYPHCTRELKTNVSTSYVRSLGWAKGTYTTAIGIRADEGDRMVSDWEDRGLWYPLIKMGITKSYVQTWWAHQAFDLDIPEHYGNCVTCWKKSDRKLWTLAKENPRLFDFMARMEAEYPNAGAGDGGRTFFRGRRSVADILTESKKAFIPFVPGMRQLELDAVVDAQSSCGDSCEIGADEEAA